MEDLDFTAVNRPAKSAIYDPSVARICFEALGKPERTASGEGLTSVLVPPIKARDFTFTSLSDAV